MNNLNVITNINPNIIKYENNYYLVISNLLGYQDNPAYSLFILINDKIFSNDNDIQIFIHSLQGKSINEISSILASGITDEFELGKDYFISYSLWNYLMSFDNGNNQPLLPLDNNDYKKPDYFDQQYNRIITDIYQNIEDTNIKYFYLLNQLNDFNFTIDELNNFISTFCTIILENTKFTNITDTKNLIYKKVLEYYQKNGKDDTSIVLDLIFNNTILSSGTNPSSCCNNLKEIDNITGVDLSSIIGTSNSSNIPCSEIYKNAMKLYLKKMLGDYNFYCDWFNLTLNNLASVELPNLVLINKLKKLFEEFKKLNYTLYFGSNATKCGCKNLNKVNSNILSESEKNYTVFDNYYDVLLLAENGEICDNKNKIKVYGENFAELLQYLYFI